jgi:hypothetical protein
MTEYATIQIIQPGTKIQAKDVKAGMVIKTGRDTIAIDRVVVKWGAVQVDSNGDWRGLELTEVVTLAGYFNLED